MALIVGGRGIEIFATIVVTLYVIGVVISKCIITGIAINNVANILSVVFVGIPVLSSIYMWLGVFFVIGSVFSFRNIA
jgi:hypothetical protein